MQTESIKHHSDVKTWELLLFYGFRDVSLPFGLYNFPRCTLGRRRTTSSGEGKEDKWLSFHWQFWLFPHLVGSFTSWGLTTPIRPLGASLRLPAQTAAFREPAAGPRGHGGIYKGRSYPLYANACGKQSKRLRAKRKLGSGLSLGHTVFPSL